MLKFQLEHVFYIHPAFFLPVCEADRRSDPEIVLQFCNKSFGDRREYLLFFPDDIHAAFQRWIERPEYQPALRAGVYKVVKRQQIPQPLAGENRAIVCQAERTFQMQPVHIAAAPARQVGVPALL